MGDGIGRAAALALLLALAGPAAAEDAPDAAAICRVVGAAAEAHGLPKPFLARLIWTESRFDAKALSPAGAQGVAQFMPGTAAARGLSDPWDHRKAIPASAELLAELRSGYGSLGIAAAAYNAGEGRVARWLRGRSGLPAETRGYVHLITGRTAEWFRQTRAEAPDRPLDPEKDFDAACAELPVVLTRAPERPPWGVIVAGGPSRGGALSAFRRVEGRLPGAARAAEVHVVRSRRGQRPVYTARLGAESQSQALGLCRSVRGAGVPCVVRRN